MWKQIGTCFFLLLWKGGYYLSKFILITCRNCDSVAGSSGLRSQIYKLFCFVRSIIHHFHPFFVSRPIQGTFDRSIWSPDIHHPDPAGYYTYTTHHPHSALLIFATFYSLSKYFCSALNILFYLYCQTFQVKWFIWNTF